MEKEELVIELEKVKAELDKVKAELEYHRWKVRSAKIIELLKLNYRQGRILLNWVDELDSEKVRLYKENRWLELFIQDGSISYIDNAIKEGFEPNEIVKAIKEHSEKIMKEQEKETPDESSK